MKTFSLEGRPYIELHNLMKIMGWCESGGRAGVLISSGAVSVNDEVELRKRRKLRSGHKIVFDQQQVIVVD